MPPKYIIAILFYLWPALLYAQHDINPKLLEAMSLYQQGKIEKAREKIAILRKEHLDDTTRSLVLSLSVEMEEKDNNYEQAIRDSEDMLKISFANEKSIRQNIARLKKNMGDFAGSEKASRRVIELDPYNELEYINLAILYNYTDRHTDAINILRSDPNQSKSEFVTNLENQHYTIAFLHLGKYDSAKVYMDKFLAAETSKKDEMIFYEAALIYSGLNDKINACKFIQQANSFITTNKIDRSIESASANIKKRWFYKRYVADIETIKKSTPLFCN